jgi:hypothetical protein
MRLKILSFCDLPLLTVAQLAGACDYGNEPSGSIKCGVFLE